jgi:predicted nucleotidyltransferase
MVEVRQKAVVQKGGRIELISDLPEGTAVEVLVSPQQKVPTLEMLHQLREEILSICAHHGASNVRVFGSVARGQANQESDVDFLVTLEKGRSLFDWGGLVADLEELLGIKVDVAPEDSLRPQIAEAALRDAIAL